jgi:RNA-binding protein 26
MQSSFNRMPSMGATEISTHQLRNSRRGKCHEFLDYGTCSRRENCPYEHVTYDAMMKNESQWQAIPNHNGGGYQTDHFNQQGNLDSMQMNSGFQRQPGHHSGSFGGYNNNRFYGPRGKHFQPHNRTREPQDTIVVDGIPEDKCNSTILNEFFSQFGTILNIQLQELEQRAIIQFSNIEEAMNAHGSPEPIFDNRFIKVFFYQADRYDNRPGAAFRARSNASQTSVRDYPTYGITPNQRSDENHPYLEVLKKKEAMLTKLTEMESALKLKLNDSNVSDEKKADARLMYQNVKKQTDAIKSGLLQDPQARSLLPKLVYRIEEDMKRDQLDRELDVLQHLKHSAIAVESGKGITPTSKDGELKAATGGPQIGYSAVIKPKPAPQRVDWDTVRSKFSLDLRSTSVLVAGFPQENKEAMLKQFHDYGDVENVVEVSENSCIFKYKTRLQAEKAIGYGPSLHSLGNLSVTWSN